jgi:hypothetical protein
MTHAEIDVDDAVARALAAIEDDLPDYAARLRELADSPRALAALGADPALGRALFVELRKLRPLSLWVRDHAARALAEKRAVSLDGAICRLAPGEQLPAPEGRECWLEVDAESAETTLRALPSGWGVIVTGDLSRLSFATLRKAAPMRALGAVLDDASPTLLEAVRAARLDVVVVRAGTQPDHAPAARMLWAVHAPDELQLGALPIASSGAVCTGENALSWALSLASLRSRPAR